MLSQSGRGGDISNADVSLSMSRSRSCGALADEVAGNALRVGTGQGPEAAILLGGIFQRPPEPHDRGWIRAQEGAVLVRPHLAAYLGLLRSTAVISNPVYHTRQVSR